MTSDFIEDACDTLDQASHGYILFVMRPNSNQIIIRSQLSENEQSVKEIAELGAFDEIILNHLKTDYGIKD